jgi:hypothetical protein
MDMIPCEICDQLIYVQDYNQHILNCELMIPITFWEEDETNDIHEGEIENMNNYITRSSQIPGGNIRSFLNDHFNGISRSNGSSPPNPSRIYVQFRGGHANIVRPDFFDNIEVGLTDEEINKVSIIVDQVNKDDMCAICQDSFKDIKVRKLKCDHMFCDNCIIFWLKKHKKCPLCKVDLEDSFLKNLNSIKTI